MKTPTPHNAIPIPVSFKLFGETIKIKQLKKVNKGDDWGYWDPSNNTIKLQKANKDYNQEQVEQTYLHESTHAILDQFGYEHLSHDEQFVERFSKALHQLLKTAHYA